MTKFYTSETEAKVLLVKRIYVDKKDGFQVEAQGLYDDFKNNLGINGLQKLRIVNR